MMTATPLVLECSVLLCFWLCLAAWQRDAMTPGRRSFMLLTLLAMCWGIGELVAVNNWLDERVADRIKYLASSTLPPLWFSFAARTAPTDLENRFPWLPFALVAPPLAAYALMYSEEWFGLFLHTVAFGDDIRGPLWIVFTVYGVALTLSGSALFVAPALRRPLSDDWKRSLAMGCFGLLPVASVSAYLLRESFWPFDPTPILLAVGLLGLRRGLLSGSVFQALSVSQHELIHQLPHGIIVTDPGGTVIEMNPAGEAILGLSVGVALGRSLDRLLDYAEEALDVQMIPVDPSGKESPQLVMIEPAAEKPPASEADIAPTGGPTPPDHWETS